MDDRVLKNPHLLELQHEFQISNFAFIVQCSNTAAASLLARNQSLLKPGYELPVQDSFDFDDSSVDSDRDTPFIDDKPSGWLFPEWRPGRFLYSFGTSSKSDIRLPDEREVSRKHFALYLSWDGVWMIRNLSQFGTWVNGDLLGIGEPGQVQFQSSLNPDVPNDIRAGNFEFHVHPIPHKPSVVQTDNAVSRLQDLELTSEGSQSTYIGLSATMYRPIKTTPETYIFLRERPVETQGVSDVVIAIHKWTGQYRTAKMYPNQDREKAYDQYEALLSLKNEKNIVPYDEILRAEDGFSIIGPYYNNATPLYQYLDDQGTANDIDLPFIVYKHISDALHSLHVNGLAHNDISNRTILVEQSSGRYIAYLTGFSEYCIVDTRNNESFRRDVSGLTSTVSKMLPALEQRLCCDPEWSVLMSQALAGQLSADQVFQGLDIMAPGYSGSPFRSLRISNDMAIHRVVDENGMEAIRLLDFLRIILHHNPKYLRSVELGIQKVIRTKDLIQLGGEIYCSLHDANKLLHYLDKNGHTILLDLTPPRHTEACWYQTEHTINIPVSYHEPTGLVNITQILNIFNTENLKDVLGHSEPASCRQIRGSLKLDGYYVDSNTIREIMKQLSLPANDYLCNVEKKCLPPSSSFGDDEGYVSITTEEMIGLIIFNRIDRKITWNRRILTVDTALKDCTDHGLLIAKETIQRVAEFNPSECSESEWTSFYTDEDIMKLFDHSDESDYPAATSHKSFQSQETIRFNPKKRKGRSDVPILPQRKALPSEAVTAAEKVKEWIDRGPDIRHTRSRGHQVSSPGRC